MALSQSFRKLRKAYSSSHRHSEYQPSSSSHFKFQDDPLELLPAHVLLQIEPGKDAESLDLIAGEVHV